MNFPELLKFAATEINGEYSMGIKAVLDKIYIDLLQSAAFATSAKAQIQCGLLDLKDEHLKAIRSIVRIERGNLFSALSTSQEKIDGLEKEVDLLKRKLSLKLSYCDEND